jgi:hypothetical protein
MATPISNPENERFSTKWISWMKSLVTGGSVAINVNEGIEHFFSNMKRPSMARLLSPFTF